MICISFHNKTCDQRSCSVDFSKARLLEIFFKGCPLASSDGGYMTAYEVKIWYSTKALKGHGVFF